MDDEGRAKLKAAQAIMPRFLFQIWSSDSGGDSCLNSMSAITPKRCFEHNQGSWRSSTPDIHSHTREKLLDMLQRHLDYDTSEDWQTEFLSWGASLSDVMSRAQPSDPSEKREGEERFEGYRVSVVDTRALPECVKVYYCPALRFLLPEGEKYTGDFTNNSDKRDYLIHGIVTRSATATANVGDWIEASVIVSDELPLREFNDAERDSTVSLKVEHILAARRLGELYGGVFVVLVAAAAVCTWRRKLANWLEQGPDDDEIRLFAEHMKPHEVPDEMGKTLRCWTKT